MSDQGQPVVQPPKPQTTSEAPRGAGRFLRFSLIYAFGDLLTKGARIVLIPYYLSTMTQAEVGELAVLQAIIIFSWTILAFGFGFVVRRYYHDYQEQGDSFVSTLWTVRLLGGLPVYGLLLLAGYAFFNYSDGTIPLEWILLAITAGFLKGGLNIVEFWLNIREEPVKYRAFTFFQFLTTTLFIIFFVSVKKLGVQGVIVGELCSYSVFAVISAFMLFRKALPSLKSVRWREVFSYCLPVLPHALFMWGLMGVDRLILNEYVDTDRIAIYEVGYLLGSFLSIIVRSMRAAWIPAYFKNAKDSDSSEQFGKVASIYFYLAFYAALGGMLFSPEIIYLFSFTSAKTYLDSVYVMRIVIFGFVAMALFLAINQPLLYERRTGLLAMISGTGLAVNVGVNLLLIPQYGIWGAAIATVIAYVVMTAMTFVITTRIYSFQWETRTNLMFGMSFLLFGALACLLPPDPNIWFIPIKIALAILFPLVTLFRLKRADSGPIKIEPRFGWTNLASLRRKRRSAKASK